MKLLAHLHDDQYPFTYIDHTRKATRGVIFNSESKIALNKLLFDDIFGHRDYYELPGGGIKDGESIIAAFHREIEEETGYKVANPSPIGKIKDYYNLIHRCNINYFYMANTTTYIGQHLEDKESRFIEKLIWVSLDEAISLYEQMDDTLISGLVKRRDLLILNYAKQIIENNNPLQ